MAYHGEGILTPVAWAQFRLNGGLKRLLGLCGIYAAAILFFNIFIYRATGYVGSGNLTSYAAGSLAFTLYGSAVLLILIGAGVINKAILREHTSDMLTSHRCTAMSGPAVILGYLTGPTLSILGITIVNWLAATILAFLAALPLLAPTVVFAMMSSLALLLWSTAALSGLCYRGKLSSGALFMPIMMLTALQPLASTIVAHPGLALLINYRAVARISSAAVGAGDAQALVIGSLCQLVLAFIFFLAASRRYLRDDVSAFTPPLAFALLALWTLVCAVGLEYFNTPAGAGGIGSYEISTQFFATLVSLLLVALLPVANAAFNAAVRATRIAKDPHFKPPRARPVWETAFISTLLAVGIFALVARSHFLRALPQSDGSLPRGLIVAITASAFFLSLFSAGALLRFVYAYTQRGFFILAIFLVVTWIVPMLIDLMLEFVGESTDKVGQSWIFACSPLGLWTLLLRGIKEAVYIGLGVQVAIAIAMQFLARRAKY